MHPTATDPPRRLCVLRLSALGDVCHVLPVVRTLQDAITGECPAYGTSWVSDASMFSRVCANTVVFGPGDIAQAHTVDEYIELEQLEKGSAVFARFLERYGQK